MKNENPTKYVEKTCKIEGDPRRPPSTNQIRFDQNQNLVQPSKTKIIGQPAQKPTQNVEKVTDRDWAYHMTSLLASLEDLVGVLHVPKTSRSPHRQKLNLFSENNNVTRQFARSLRERTNYLGQRQVCHRSHPTHPYPTHYISYPFNISYPLHPHPSISYPLHIPYPLHILPITYPTHYISYPLHIRYISFPISFPLHILPITYPAHYISYPLHILPITYPTHYISYPLHILPITYPTHYISYPLHILPPSFPLHILPVAYPSRYISYPLHILPITYPSPLHILPITYPTPYPTQFISRPLHILPITYSTHTYPNHTYPTQSYPTHTYPTHTYPTHPAHLLPSKMIKRLHFLRSNRGVRLYVQGLTLKTALVLSFWCISLALLIYIFLFPILQVCFLKN